MASRRKNKTTERAKLDATPPWETRVRPELAPTDGPFDERDAPDDDLPRVDLGALRVPVGEGLDLRLEVNEAQQVIAVTLAGAHGSMQLGVFAAPRNEGIWDDVRAEIAASMNSQRGQAKERLDGPFGTELHGKLPGDGGAAVPVRFIGVDGPRWFLRAMLIGAVATEDAKAEPYLRALRNVVVVRGNDPLPVREPVELRLPRDVVLPEPGDGTEAAPDGDEDFG
ncbi:MAG TPA: DUF3710 domain-containing protein [Jatrophihabitantaceae bacterium]|nr:DUF3710 domain-containing protein [Jatrophihabitantaceae bacterium]